jgi:hypothetical protein
LHRGVGFPLARQWRRVWAPDPPSPLWPVNARPQDIVSGSYAENVTLYQNDGAFPPNFTQHISVSVGSAWFLLAVDWNADGWPDLVSASNMDSEIALHINLGTRPVTFDRVVVGIDCIGASSVAVADVGGECGAVVPRGGGWYVGMRRPRARVGRLKPQLECCPLRVCPPSLVAHSPGARVSQA